MSEDIVKVVAVSAGARGPAGPTGPTGPAGTEGKEGPRGPAGPENTKATEEVAAEKTRALAAEATKAPLASPALTGIPTTPTAPALTDNTQIATTAYADGAVAVEKARAETAEATLIPLIQKGATGGVATLDSKGQLPTAQLPSLSITDPYVVNSEAAQLALEAHKGDVAIRSDVNKSFIQNGGTAKTMADWTELVTPGDVTSVNGQTGTVNLTAASVGADASGAAATAEAKSIPLSQKGAINGVATLDGEDHLPAAQLPPSVARGSAGGLLLPSEVATYTNPSANVTENRAALAESPAAIPFRVIANTAVILISGTPRAAVIVAPPNTTISGIGFYVKALEATPANRTHLWVALLNANLETLRVSADYTSATNTPLIAEHMNALALTSTYTTGGAPEVLYAVICEVMSSTSPITIITREAIQGSVSETKPYLGLVGNTGRTTPASLASPMLAGPTIHTPMMVLV